MKPGSVFLPVNPKLIKQLQGADYVDGTTVHRLLDEAFGPENWTFEVQDRWETQFENRDRTFNVLGRMGIRTTHGDWVYRSAMAGTSYKGKVVKGGGKAKDIGDVQAGEFILGNTEDAWKQTITDCLKKAASGFGIAQELYGKGSEPIMALHADPEFTPRQVEMLREFSEKWDLDKTDPEYLFLLRKTGIGRFIYDLHQQNVDEFVELADAYLTKVKGKK